MTPRLLLRHLTFVGSKVETATIEFGPRTTIITGASDTGKSFIVDALDFMFGGRSLKQIPERDGYAQILLGLTLPSGEEVTVVRGTDGGGFTLYEGDHRTVPVQLAKLTLGPNHSSKSDSSLSRYLLQKIDLDQRWLLKNQYGGKESLSFRDLAHLCVIDETRMQDGTQPGLTGNPTNRTKELSALKLLLVGEDDSAITDVGTPQARSKRKDAQLDIVDRMIQDFRDQLTDQPDEEELRDQHARLNAAILEISDSVELLSAARLTIAAQLAESEGQLLGLRRRFDESTALQARFQLLGRQYESDLQRLEMVSEAGTILGFFSNGECAFCGAALKHQVKGVHLHEGETDFGVVVAKEALKIRALQEDLVNADQDISRQLALLEAGETALENEIMAAHRRLRDAELALEPQRGSLHEFVAQKSQVESTLGLHERVRDLEQLRAQIEDDARFELAVSRERLSVGSANSFSTQIQLRLQAWGYPESEHVRYDRKEMDVVDATQTRKGHGKGVRAILHAAFTLGLADHCFLNDLPHPGFAVIDSPLVVYRAPASSASTDREASGLASTFVADFYRDLQSTFEGQLIVMENDEPPESLMPTTVGVHFTKTPGVGRYGFFPHRPRVVEVSELADGDEVET